MEPSVGDGPPRLQTSEDKGFGPGGRCVRRRRPSGVRVRRVEKVPGRTSLLSRVSCFVPSVEGIRFLDPHQEVDPGTVGGSRLWENRFGGSVVLRTFLEGVGSRVSSYERVVPSFRCGLAVHCVCWSHRTPGVVVGAVRSLTGSGDTRTVSLNSPGSSFLLSSKSLLVWPRREDSYERPSLCCPGVFRRYSEEGCLVSSCLSQSGPQTGRWCVSSGFSSNNHR